MLPVQVSSKHKLVGVPAREDVANLFPGAKRHEFNGVEHILLPHGPTETFMLRKLGYDVPAPILSHYKWTGTRAPFDVQRKTCALLTLNTRAYVLNDMGTGKTACPLWAWDYLRGNNLAGKMLVVAPLSTLHAAWEREIFNVLPHRKCVVLHGTKAKRIEKLKDPDAEIYIINHDGLKVLAAELGNRPDIDTLVLDELAVYRNGKSERTKYMRKFAYSKQWVWGMTGGPIPREPTDAWAQATIITPQNVPKYFTRFRDELMNRVTQFKYVPKPDAEERAFAVLQPAVRFALSDVTELPEAVGLNPMRMVEIEMGAKQQKAYKDMANFCRTIAGQQQQDITAANAGAAMMKLLQIALGWVYTADRETIEFDNDKRLQRLVDDLYSTSHKALVFVPFKHALDGVSKVLTKEGFEHAVISGDTPAGQRANVFTAFQSTNKYKCIAAHPQCLAHGVTLTAADLVIWFGPVTSLEIYDQANRRIRRVGQQHKQLYLHYLSSPVERRIYKMLEQHQKVQDKLLELFEIATKELVL